MDPVTLQVMANALRAVAEEMEAALVRSAFSPNIVERRDCSTAIFDGAGRMVVQSASIPVHLGAMPEAVAAARERGAAPGEVWLVNDPYRGGTHLPDLTMISALPLEGATAAYAVTRAHHADVGGMAPGSMPAGSRELLQEGLVIPPVRIVRDGATVSDVVELVLANSRAPGEREGDLRAQLAAHRLAERRLARGRRAPRRRPGARGLRRAAGLRRAPHPRRDRRDAGRPLRGGRGPGGRRRHRRRPLDPGGGHDRRRRHGGRLRGHRPPGPRQLQLPAGGHALGGLLRGAVRDRSRTSRPRRARSRRWRCGRPRGRLVNARPPAAVAGGNVETSSRIVDAVTAALGAAIDVPAQGQGTMNNLTLGGAGFTYYETLGGGQGASSRADGPSGVHVAMSNTLNTPVEALETAYPLRVEAYRLRRGSGGAGRHRGGDGVERRIRLLVDAEASVIAERRRRGPRGPGGRRRRGHRAAPR